MTLLPLIFRAGKADGSGQSTKATMQQLYDIDGPQVPTPAPRRKHLSSAL
jgi:hypothetical protein